MDTLSKVLKKAEKEKDSLGHPYVGTEHLLLAILSKDNYLVDKLKKHNLTYNNFKKRLINTIGKDTNNNNLIIYTPMLKKVINEAYNLSTMLNKEVDEEILLKALIKEKEGIAIRVLEDMNIDINLLLKNNNKLVDDITNREEEISNIIQVLMRKNKSNPILIGEAGVGKTAIVEELERRINAKKVPNELLKYKIKKIDLSYLVAGSKYRGDFEEKMNNILKDAEETNTILFIDEIHTIIKAGGAEGAIAAGDIVKPYLARGSVKCIGATTFNEYHEYFIKDEALNRRFQPIIIKETNKDVTINILKNLKKNYEQYHNIKISNDVIKEIVEFGIKYQINKRNPDKSIELLDSCCTYARYNELNKLNKDILYNVFYETYGINIKNNRIKDIIDNEQILLTNNINDILNNFNTINCNIININCTDYQNELDIYDLLGNPKDYNHNNNYLFKKVINIPVGVLTIKNYSTNKVLDDLIDKIINKRKIIDNFGNIINFKNYLIILEDNINNNTLGFIKHDKEIVKYIRFNKVLN